MAEEIIEPIVVTMQEDETDDVAKNDGDDISKEDYWKKLTERTTSMETLPNELQSCTGESVLGGFWRLASSAECETGSTNQKDIA